MENIFNVEDTDTPTIEEDVNYLEQLVGEDKKFKDYEGLAKGKYQADLTIDTLKKKLDEMSTELKTRMSLEEMMTELRKPQRQQQPEPVVTPQGDNPKPALDDSNLESRLEEILAQREAKKAQETNLEKVTRVMTEQFGDNAGLVINKRSKELGMSREELNRLATTSPSAFFALVNVSPESAPPTNQPSVPQNRVNSTATVTTGLRDAKYYEKLKQTDPKKYFDPKTTNEMIKDRAALGSKFYS